MNLVSTLSPGMRIPNQDDLSKQLGVSRTVVREALSKLEFMNAISTAPKRGTTVNERSKWRSGVVQAEPRALTDDRIHSLWALHYKPGTDWVYPFARAIERALKEQP
jgi:DNA-binding FadR family transcriptional regulator